MLDNARLSLFLLTMVAASANAVVFSVDNVSTGLPGTDVGIDAAAADPQLRNNTYFNDHNTSNNTRQKTGADIGVSQNQNVVGMSRGTDELLNPTELLFSVSSGSVGAVGSAVNVEAGGNGVGADVFMMAHSAPTHSLAADAAELGLAGADNIDAFDVFDPIAPNLTVLSSELYFTVDSTVGGIAAGNIYLSDLVGGVTLFKSSATMGLSGGDVIDAFALDVANDMAMFSLASGSTSLGGSFSAADVFSTSFSGSFALEIAHGDLGLLFTDDIDAMDTNATVAEPAGVDLVLTGLLGVIGMIGIERARSARGGRAKAKVEA